MFLHSLRDSLAWVRNPYRILDHYLDKGKLSFHFHLLGMGRVFVTGESSLIESAIRNPLLIGGRGTRALRPVVGDEAMIVQEGCRHRAHRNLVTPFFSSVSVDRYENIVIDEANRRLLRIGMHENFSALRLFHDINLATIVRVTFGELPQARRDHLYALIDRYVGSFASPWVLFLRPLHISLGRATPWGRFVGNRLALRNAIGDELRDPNPDTLAAAVRQRMRDGTLSREEGIDAVLEILLFGHDTAAAALAWWAAYLYSHKEALQRALAEASAGSTSFIRATLHESMRLAPVVVHLTRVATDRTELGDNLINAGEHIFLCAYLAQRDPRRFERPQAYLPERFLGEKESPWGFGYFPFGLGNRLCAGMSFALRQMELVACRFLARGQFCLRPGQVLTAERQLVIMVPNRGLIMSRAG